MTDGGTTGDDRPVAVIVDGYSTGAALAPEFARRGWACVHVSSRPDIDPVYQAVHRPETYRAGITHRGDLAETLAALAPFRPRAVLPGAEIGVELADALAEGLGLAGNGTALSAARRDKFLMARAVARAGLATAPQFRTGDAPAARDWARDQGRWPVVVKPLNSAGTDGVTICQTPDQLDQAFARIHGKRNRLGLINDDVLIQGFLQGRQYFINTVSLAGRHLVAEIWVESKRQVAEAAFINDLEMLLPADGPVQALLADYTMAVLDALGISHGPAHTEVMLTDAGPVLIETAARLMGTVEQRAVMAALGETQVTLTVDACTDPEGFSARLDRAVADVPYRMQGHLWCVALISGQTGRITSHQGLSRLERLASYVSRINIAPIGSLLAPTVDFFSSPGVVYLLHEDQAVLAADYACIRAWERDGLLFDVAPAG